MDVSLNTYLFIDTSYFVFYRYFSVFYWFKRFRPNVDLQRDNIMNNAAFIEKYVKTFESSILELMKEFKVAAKNVIFAKDCPRDCIWRMDHYPAYKGNREEKLDTFNKEIFKHTYQVILPQLVSRYSFKEMEYERLEADDVIALSIQHLKKQDPCCNIVVITNDNDYVQLLKHGITLVNLQRKHLQDRIQDHQTYLQRKIIMGDKSDNIPAIIKKCGDKTAERLLQDATALQKLLTQTEVKEQYELNELLIDLDRIPLTIANSFFENFDWLWKALKDKTKN